MCIRLHYNLIIHYISKLFESYIPFFGGFILTILSIFKRFSLFSWILDSVILFLFILIGLQQHDIHNNTWYPVLAYLPFIISWTIIGFASRAFSFCHEMSSRERLIRVIAGWFVALGLALILRYYFFDKLPIASFAIVAFIFNGVLFVLWRVFFVRWCMPRNEIA